MNHDQLEIRTPYFTMNLSNLLYISTKVIWDNCEIEVSFDNVIHDYLILLRYYDTYSKAKNEIKKRLVKEGIEIKNIEVAYAAVDALMDSIYYQMVMYNLYNRGEYDYRFVKTSSIQIRGWLDEHSPVFEFIDMVIDNTNIERFSYLIY